MIITFRGVPKETLNLMMKDDDLLLDHLRHFTITEFQARYILDIFRQKVPRDLKHFMLCEIQIDDTEMVRAEVNDNYRLGSRFLS